MSEPDLVVDDVVYLTDEEVLALGALFVELRLPGFAHASEDVSEVEIEAGLRSLVVRGLLDLRAEGMDQLDQDLRTILECAVEACEHVTLVGELMGGRFWTMTWYAAGDRGVIHQSDAAGVNTIGVRSIETVCKTYGAVLRGLSASELSGTGEVPPLADRAISVAELESLFGAFEEASSVDDTQLSATDEIVASVAGLLVKYAEVATLEGADRDDVTGQRLPVGVGEVEIIVLRQSGTWTLTNMEEGLVTLRSGVHIPDVLSVLTASSIEE